MPDARAIPATAKSLEKILDLRPVLWVGAGVSVAAGHPGTRALTDAMIARADDAIDPGLGFEQVADAFVESEGRGALGDLLQSLIGGSTPLTELHHAIARRAAGGGFAALVTTNYDDLLERALGEAEARYVHQGLEDNAVVVDPESDVRLLKLHGSRDDWRRVVLSGESYATFAHRYPFLEKQLDVLLRRHPVLFVGCSLQDPRSLDWLGALGDDALDGLKPWRPMMTRKDWDEAVAAGPALRRAVDARFLRPLILDDHDHLPRLWTEVSPPPAPADSLDLELTVTSTGITARMDGGETWSPDDPLADDDLLAAIDALRDTATQPLPTDEHGAVAPQAAAAAALLHEAAAPVGERLARALLSDAAHARLSDAVRQARGGRPVFLRLRVAADGEDAGPVHRADRLLALPWELLYLEGRFPVREHTLDLAREAVVEKLDGLIIESR